MSLNFAITMLYYPEKPYSERILKLQTFTKCMSHDDSKGGNPFDFDFEESLKKTEKEFEKWSKNFDKQLELQEKISDENAKKIRKNM